MTAKLIYTAITSLDGYVADVNGNFEWSAPDDDVHAFVNDLERPIGTYLLGRRMYEVLAAWETFDGDTPVAKDFARIWRSKDKIVYSSTLSDVTGARTRLERIFDPEAVRALKQSSDVDISVAGPHLAAQAIRAGGSWTRSVSSSTRSWSAAGTPRFRTASSSSSSSSMITGSRTACCTCGTRWLPREP